MLRHLRAVRGADTSPYRILTVRGTPHYEVATAQSPEELSELCGRLRSLEQADLIEIALDESLDRKTRLEKIIALAQRVPSPAVSQESSDSVFVEVLSKISALESNACSKEQEILELRTQLAHTRKQICLEVAEARAEERAEVALVLADQNADVHTSSIEQSHDPQDGQGKAGVEDLSVAGEVRSDDSPDGQITAAVQVSDEALLCTSKSAQGFMIHSQTKQSLPKHEEPSLPESQSSRAFAESLLSSSDFDSSLIKKFWQLAQATYNMGQENVIQGREMWDVVAYAPKTNTKVIGRVLSNGQLEVGFRGTVAEDAQGHISNCNWSTNLTQNLVALDAQLTHGDTSRSAVTVHEGFQNAYLAVRSPLLKWLSEQSAASRPKVRFAGHSLGGALSTLAAVDIKRAGWPVVAVITFGSPKVGGASFAQIYQRLGLGQCTARYVNDADPVPMVPRSANGFEHVVAHRSLSDKKAILGLPAISAHSMIGNPLSYFQTLHDCIEGPSPAAGIVARKLTTIAAERNAETKALLQGVEVDVRSVQNKLADLFTELSVSVEQVTKAIADGHMWDWAETLRAHCQVARRNMEVLPSWSQVGLPQWLMDLQVAEQKVFKAALHEAQDPHSQSSIPLAQLIVQEAALEMCILRVCQAPQPYILKEATRFEENICALLREHKGNLVYHLEFISSLRVLAETLRVAQKQDALTAPGDGEDGQIWSSGVRPAVDFCQLLSFRVKAEQEFGRGGLTKADVAAKNVFCMKHGLYIRQQEHWPLFAFLGFSHKDFCESGILMKEEEFQALEHFNNCLGAAHGQHLNAAHGQHLNSLLAEHWKTQL